MVKVKHTLGFALVCLFLQSVHSSPAAEETNLSAVISSMEPGTWKELTNMKGFKIGAGFVLDDQSAGNTRSILEFSDKAVWDPTAKRFLFYGSSHGATVNRFVQYDEVSNSWSVLPLPPSEVGSGSHSYEHNAIDPVHRAYFYIQRGTTAVERLDLNDYTTWSKLPPNDLIGYKQCCIAIEWFPDMDGLVWFASGEKSTGSGLFIWKRSTNKWERLAEDLPSGYTSGFAAYDPVHKVVLFGGGYDHDSTPIDDSRPLYKLDVSGKVTRLADAPLPTGVMQSVTTVDPVTGQLLVFASGQKFYTFDVTTNKWALQAGKLPAIWDGPQTAYDVFDIVATPVSNYGVTMFVKYASPTYAKVYLYKHAARGAAVTTPPAVPVQPPTNPVSLPQSKTSLSSVPVQPSVSPVSLPQAKTAAPAGPVATTTQPATSGDNSFDQKCAQPGVLGCWGFNDASELKYGWDGSSAALNKALAGQTTHYISLNRTATEGNTVAIEHVSGAVSIPMIDKTVFSSGGGSLKFTIPSQSEPQVGWFQDSFNKVLGNPSVYISPKSALGNVVYYQFRLRVNDAMLNTVFRVPAAGFNYSLSTPAPASTTIKTSNGSFTPSMVGKPIALQGPSAVSPWIKGIYTISSFVDANTITVDRSPTPTAAGTQGHGTLGGDDTPDFRAGGWKTIIIFGNSPKGSSSSSVEVTMNNPKQVGIPVMYGQQGMDGYGWQDVRGCTWSTLDRQLTFNSAKYSDPPCKRFKANEWIELTGRIEVRGASNAPESRVQLWVDGELVVDYDKAKIAWGGGDGDGLGQFDLTPYHTGKDPTQIHPTGYVWYDDMIVSTKPIAMTSPQRGSAR